MEKTTIAYLGPAGTNCDEAARVFACHMGKESATDNFDFIACPSFAEVFDAVERGQTDYGVVAVENSLEGSVTSTLDLFAFGGTSRIVGQTVLDIHHCLLIAPTADLADVQRVASHPQGLAQCRRFLSEQLRGCETITVSSTAEAARLAADDPHMAAIADEYAAKLYGTQVYAREIGDRVRNATSFALISRNKQPAFSHDGVWKTSLALFLQDNKKGSLNMILSEFAYAGIDLSMIQSRPTKQGLGDYMFFVDILSCESDPRVQTALNCLRLKLREVKVLGTYPLLS